MVKRELINGKEYQLMVKSIINGKEYQLMVKSIN